MPKKKQPESRHVSHHPTPDTLPKLPPGNGWRLCEQLGEWEIVMTAEHPKAGDHPLPPLPPPVAVFAESDLYDPLPARVDGMRRVGHLTSQTGEIVVSVDVSNPRSRELLGAHHHWQVVMIPLQGGPEVDRS